MGERRIQDKKAIEEIRDFVKAYNKGGELFRISTEPMMADRIAKANDRSELHTFVLCKRGVSDAYFATRPTKERNLWFGINLTKRLCSTFGISRFVQDEAIRRFKVASERNAIKGRAIEAVVAALILGACREDGRPVNVSELAYATCADPKSVLRVYKRLSRSLGFKLVPGRAEDYVNKFCDAMNLSEPEKSAVSDMISSAKGWGMNRSVKTLVAAAIYIVSGKLTQKELASRLKVSEVSLRDAVHDMRQRLPPKGAAPRL